MDEITIDAAGAPETKKRPTFLTVLCILTFVGSGLGIISGIMGFFIFTPEQTYAILEGNAARMGAEIPQFAEYSKWMTYNNAVSLLSAVLGLIGGLMMFKLKKTGFVVYLFSWVASVGISAASFKYTSDSVTAELFPIVIAISVLLMAAFVIMYAVNLKHMK